MFCKLKNAVSFLKIFFFFIHVSDDCSLFCTAFWSIFILQKKFNSIKEKKMIGHHTSLQENDNLPLWRALTIKKKPPFLNVRALITREIMRSKDAQCNNKE